MTTLYEKLGGEGAIQAVVDGMYAKIFSDPELTDFFRKTDKQRQKDMQFAFLSQVTGGPQAYTGRSMKDVHKGRGIQEKEFGLVAGHVVSTMNELKFPQELID
jgi:hemoglobin